MKRESGILNTNATLECLALVALCGAMSQARPAEGGRLQVWPEFPYIPDAPADLLVVDVYAYFSSDNDHVLAVYGTFDEPLALSYVPDEGVFFNSDWGWDGPPQDWWLYAHPELEWDTFGTIGMTSYPDASPIHFYSFFPGFNEWGLGTYRSGWWIDPDDPAGYAGNHPGRAVQIARIVAPRLYDDDGECAWYFTGIVKYQNGQTVYDEEFWCPSNLGGNNCGGPPDCNGNGIFDLLDIDAGDSQDLNENNIPDECECLADVTEDSQVNIDDVFSVLALWGVCDDCPEDLNFDGVVNIDDLFVVLANWGPCS